MFMNGRWGMIMLGLCFFQHSHTYTGKLLVSPHLSLPRPLISLSSPYTTIWSVIGKKRERQWREAQISLPTTACPPVHSISMLMKLFSFTTFSKMLKGDSICMRKRSPKTLERTLMLYEFCWMLEKWAKASPPDMHTLWDTYSSFQSII